MSGIELINTGGVACWDCQRGGLSGGGRRGVGGRLSKKEKGAAVDAWDHLHDRELRYRRKCRGED